MTPWQSADLIDRYLAPDDQRRIWAQLQTDYRNWRLSFEPVPEHRGRVAAVIVSMVRGWPAVTVIPRTAAPVAVMAGPARH